MDFLIIAVLFVIYVFMELFTWYLKKKVSKPLKNVIDMHFLEETKKWLCVLAYTILIYNTLIIIYFCFVKILLDVIMAVFFLIFTFIYFYSTFISFKSKGKNKIICISTKIISIFAITLIVVFETLKYMH